MKTSSILTRYPESAVEIKRTPEFTSMANRLSDYIKSLPLSQNQNNELIKLMIEQIQIAENGAFKQGFSMGVEIMRDTELKNE